MHRFKISHAKHSFPVWVQKSARNIRSNLSRIMSSSKNVKATPTPLIRLPTITNIMMSSMIAQNISTIDVEDSASSIYMAGNKTASAPEVNAQPVLENKLSSPPAVRENNNVPPLPYAMKEKTAAGSAEGEREQTKALLKMLQNYKNLTEKAYFQSNTLPTNAMMNTIWEAENKVFPQVLEAFNARHGLDIKYTNNINKIVDYAIGHDGSGRQQFIFDSGEHSVLVDLYKDSADNISVITIDTLTSANDFCAESLLARKFNKRNIPEGKLALLSFKTEAQKNYQGCKYFNMHFAKTAIKDNVIAALHKESINVTQEQAAANYKKHAAGTYIKTKPHPHTFISVAETAEYLNSRYYKHSHSSTRLYALPQKRHEEAIFKGANVIERASQFRVQKKQIIETLEKESGKDIEQESVKEKVLNFSNSLDYFRRKRIIEAEEFLQARLAKQLA